jgi:hypothetical protein
MLSPVWPLPALLIAVPLVVHVEETGPLRPPQEAALASLSSVIEETLGPVRMDATVGPCGEECVRALRSQAEEVLLVRVFLAVRRTRIELTLGSAPGRLFGFAEGTPNSETFRDALRQQLLPLLKPTSPSPRPELTAAAPPPASSARPWVFAGAVLAAGAAVGCGAAFAADTSSLKAELTYSPRAESIDARRAIIGPLAVGLAVSAVALALGGALLAP